MWLLSLSKEGAYQLTEFGDQDYVPAYAILSHTWVQSATIALAKDAEPTFQDLREGTGQEKPGYKKVEFCGLQARVDGVKYFWVDTCCINKENPSELSHAIRSMCQWYRNAARCYVYLSDVHDSTYTAVQKSWDSEFYKSRWFTRGWTLQELLAPRSVEFFTAGSVRLGDRTSLRQQISEITDIPISALLGHPLSRFSREERFQWSSSRETTQPEDKAYSLLGLFDVNMEVNYGEGAGNANQRLKDTIERRDRCIRDIRLTDPSDDKRRIEDSKGGLLEDAYRWIMQNPEFQQWRSVEQSSILWIKGDAGKGKTMLVCGIIDELQKLSTSTATVAYFLCQATDRRLDNATAVLRGLLFMLLRHQPSLASHVQAEYDIAGRSLFEDVNARVALAKILQSMLTDSRLDCAYLVIDALDECLVDLDYLLEFIITLSSHTSYVKWIVSSRNYLHIEEYFKRAAQAVTLSLELNAASVASAVVKYIDYKVGWLVRRKRYSNRLRVAVRSNLLSHADDTFLWVALACQELARYSAWEAEEKSLQFPEGLNQLYRRMLDHTISSRHHKLCRGILAVASVAQRPLTLDEMETFVDVSPAMLGNEEAWADVVGHCGSFLSLRGRTITFVHQSAKEFLVQQAYTDIFPSGIEDTHHSVFTRSLHLILTTLHRDMYDLRDAGIFIDDVSSPPSPDPLGKLRYPCVYWPQHLNDSDAMGGINDRADSRLIDDFFRKSFLFWLETLSLSKSMSDAQLAISQLESLLQQKARRGFLTPLHLVVDARRFMMYHRYVIERFPLQTYTSALLFSPRKSLIRELYSCEEPGLITITAPVGDHWSACLQTFEGHTDWVFSVAFSHDSTWLASASRDGTVKIWNTSCGTCSQTLESFSGGTFSVAFSHDSSLLASADADRIVRIWDIASSVCIQTLDCTLDGLSGNIRSISFSHDSSQLASASQDAITKIWDIRSGECLQTFEGGNSPFQSVAFSHDSTRLASPSKDGMIKIWNISSGACERTLKKHLKNTHSVAFSHDSTRVVSTSADHDLKIWDASSGTCLQTVPIWDPLSVAISHNSNRLACASGNAVRILDASSGNEEQTLKGHIDNVSSVAFSHNSLFLASASWDCTVKIWDTASSAYSETEMLESHDLGILSIAVSHDSSQLASASWDSTIKIWNTVSNTCLRTLTGHGGEVRSVKFSHDSSWLASASWDHTIKIWLVATGACLRTLKGHTDKIGSVTISHDSTRLASASEDGSVKVWDAFTGACLQTLDGHSDIAESSDLSQNWVRFRLPPDSPGSVVGSVAFSHDSTQLASSSCDGVVKIWIKNSDGYVEEAQETNLDVNWASKFRRQIVGTSPDGEWILQLSKKVLWVPLEHRPNCAAASNELVGIGTSTGQVWTCRFNSIKD